MCIIDINIINCNVYVFLREECSIGWLCCWNIFDKSLYFIRYITFKSKFVLFYITVTFIHFYYVFALDSLKISSVLNPPLQGPLWRARSHIVLEYNDENMRSILYIFRFTMIILHNINRYHIVCTTCKSYTYHKQLQLQTLSSHNSQVSVYTTQHITTTILKMT